MLAGRQTNKQTHWLSTILRPLAYGLWSNKTSISAYCRLFPIVHLVIDLHCLYQLLYACMQLMWYLSSGSCSQSGASCFWLDFNVKLIQIDAGILTCWQSNACSCFVWATLYVWMQVSSVWCFEGIPTRARAFAAVQLERITDHR